MKERLNTLEELLFNVVSSVDEAVGTNIVGRVHGENEL